MKKTGLAILMTILCAMAWVGTAAAESYNFSWKNNMNMFTYSHNSDALCNVTTELRTGKGAVASKTIPSLRAEEQMSITLSAPVCNLVKISATCTFKDYAYQKKTETKEMTTTCQGGEGYLSPSPMSQTWTTFSINLYNRQ